MNLMKRLLFFGMMLLLVLQAFPQGAIKKQRKLSDKFFFGGGLGFQFGDIAAIEINPLVGYVPFNNTYVGLKGSYQFYKDNRFNESTDIYGGSLFGMYNFVDKVALYAEYEVIGLQTSYFTSLQSFTEKDRYWIHSPLAGIGFVQPINERSKMVLMLLWSFNDKAYSPYQNPLVRFMIMI